MQLSRALLNLWPQHNRVSRREDSSTVMWQTNSAVAERAAFVRTLLIKQRIETNSELQKLQPLCWEKQQLCSPFFAFYCPDWIWKDCICFLSHQSTLWACVQLIAHLDPLVLSCITVISNLVSCMEPRRTSDAFLLRFPVTSQKSVAIAVSLLNWGPATNLTQLFSGLDELSWAYKLWALSSKCHFHSSP